jgi:hypothetical protein
MRTRMVTTAVVLLLLLGGACGGDGDGPGKTSTEGGDRSTTVAPTTTTAPDPASVGANELGSVPVVMYHRIVPQVKGEFDRTPEQFRAELTRLHDAGFRPVTAREYVTGDMPIEAGRSPVVLTFDDSTRDQFALTAAGEVDPSSAIGILLDFAASHPGFRPIATMYVNHGPFGVADSGPVLRKLHELGFELGNHTANHVNLSKLDTAAAQREIVLGRRVITAAVPEASVETFALPLGIRPPDRSILTRGAAEGEAYELQGVFLVGAGPAPSPFAATFERAAIPRIRSSDWEGGEPNYGTSYWLDWYAKHPDRRYVSDGVAATVSFPRGAADQLGSSFQDRARPY